MKSATTCVLACAALVGCCAAASAEEIPWSAFSGTATVIDFNSLTGGSTVTSGELINTQFAAQGVTFVNPLYPTYANANLAPLFATNSDPNIAFCHQGGGSDPNSQPQEIHFSVPINRVGVWFGTSANSTFTIRVYNGGTLLEEIVKTGSPLGAFGLEGFVGVQRTETITMVRLNSSSLNPLLYPFNFSFDDLIFEALGSGCYPNCDQSTTPPILNIADFACFLQRFAAADPYANCDQSTTPPTLNIADFSCFLQKFAAGCN
jgi:hypothetical protein